MRMAYLPRTSDKRRSSDEFTLSDDDMMRVQSRGNRPMSPKSQLEHEKRLRREIANSNERRRMQSINAGFESLKTLLPQHDGEKLSKAAILQQTSEYITALEQDKSRLMAENTQLKSMLSRFTELSNLETSSQDGSPPPKRKKRDTESSDEGIGMSVGSLEEVDEQVSNLDDLRREMIELRRRENQTRMVVEEQSRAVEAQLYPERLRAITTQLHAQMKSQQEKQKYMEDLHQTRVMRPHEVREAEMRHSTASSMSRRNLETIVEAIRHLEGDHVLQERRIPAENSCNDRNSCNSVDDHEECKSEVSSGRESPVCINSELAAAPMAATATIHVSSEKYPIASQLLHPDHHHHTPATASTTHTASLPTAFLQQRPGVIVTNLS